jgi:hypothetical protein
MQGRLQIFADAMQKDIRQIYYEKSPSVFEGASYY